MRLIFVNRFFHPDESATSRMVSSLAFALAREGHDVAALCSGGGESPAPPAAGPVEGVEIVRLASSKHAKAGLLRRACADLGFHARTAFWLLSHLRRGDVCVVCTDPPLYTVTLAPVIALRRAIMVNWVMDLFPEVAIELGVIRRRGVLARLSLALRDLSLRAAALVVCPIGAMADRLAARGVDPDRLAVIRLWSMGAQIAPVARGDNSLRRDWGYGEELVVGHSGNFGRAHDFTTLLGAAERLKDDRTVRFLLIGDGAQRKSVEAHIRDRNLTNVAVKPLQPRESLSESLSAADVHIVSLAPALENCIVPSKVYGVLAAGRPVAFVGSLSGEVARMGAAADCGVAIEIGDVEALTRAIRALRDDPARRLAMGRRARDLFLSDYGAERGHREWQAALERLRAAMPRRAGVIGTGEVAE